MEQLYNSYKKIVNRAIAVGLVSENNKSYYLSAIPSDCFLNSKNKERTFKKKRLQKRYAQYSDLNTSNQTHANSAEMKQIFNDAERNNDLHADPNYFKITYEIIENLSILNLENMHQIEMHPFDSDSDNNSDLVHNKKSHSDAIYPAVLLSRCKSEMLREKPKRNEVINFNIPIYLDISRKSKIIKSTVNSFGSPMSNYKPQFQHKRTVVCRTGKKSQTKKSFKRSALIDDWNSDSSHYIENTTFIKKSNKKKKVSKDNNKFLNVNIICQFYPKESFKNDLPMSGESTKHTLKQTEKLK